MKNTVLIIEDEKEIQNLIEIYMQGEGYEIFKANDGFEGVQIIENKKIDIVILDVMMPGIDGIRTCLKIREKKQMPIIMLSAKDQDQDKILGLHSGADDYMSKPFNPLELVARVKSQLRRYQRLGGDEKTPNTLYQVGELVLNADSHQITIAGETIFLTPLEFKILELLMKNQGIVLSNETIYERVWGQTFFDPNTVMVHIRKIREKIGDSTKEPTYIKTIWGVGYTIEK